MKLIDYINSLPDSYQKHSESNNYKLLSLEERLVSELRSDIEAVDLTADIYSATGKTLDLYGKIYGKPRGTATDEQYRFMILQRVAQTLTSGDYNSVVSSIAVIFAVPVTDLRLRETENICEVEVINLPYSVLMNAGFTEKQTTDLVLSLLPAGISLAPMNLSGTFEFGAETNIATAFGKLLALKDSEHATLRGLNIYGRTAQDGTPSPDAPAELVSAGDSGTISVSVQGKNLLHKPTSQTLNGITFTVDDDGVITLNGTATDVTYYLVDSITFKAGESYAISGCPEGGGDDKYGFYVLSSQQNYVFDYGTGAAFTCEADFTSNVRILVQTGQVMDNVKFYPMIRLASHTDATYQPPKAVQTLNVQAPNGLAGIPVASGGNFTDETGQQWVCDEVDFERGVYIQRTKLVSLSEAAGWHTWGVSYQTAGNTGFYKNDSDICGGIPNVLCSIVPFNNKAWGGAVIGASTTVKGTLYYTVSVPNASLEDVSTDQAAIESFIKLAQETDAKLLLARTPIEVPLTEEELAAYAALRTNAPNTTVYNDADALMRLAYVSAEKNLEYDEDAGFGNIEQTIGGYLGLLSEIKRSDQTN